ncbi:hypothetical protein [Scytonema hofmannii]
MRRSLLGLDIRLHPNVASSGVRWWEIDVTWWTIQALNILVLAKKIVS